MQLSDRFTDLFPSRLTRLLALTTGLCLFHIHLTQMLNITMGMRHDVYWHSFRRYHALNISIQLLRDPLGTGISGE